MGDGSRDDRPRNDYSREACARGDSSRDDRSRNAYSRKDCARGHCSRDDYDSSKGGGYRDDCPRVDYSRD